MVGVQRGGVDLSFLKALTGLGAGGSGYASEPWGMLVGTVRRQLSFMQLAVFTAVRGGPIMLVGPYTEGQLAVMALLQVVESVCVKYSAVRDAAWNFCSRGVGIILRV